MSKSRDFAVIRFFYFADAAFARARSTKISAAQRFSPKQPFKRAKKGDNQTALSLHFTRTRKMLDIAAVQDSSGKGRLAAVFAVVAGLFMPSVWTIENQTILS